MCFLSFMCDMIILPDLHPINASIMSNHSLSIINGWPPKFDFGCRTRKSTGYSQESKETMISSSTFSGTTLDLLASSKIVVVCRIFGKFKHCMVSIVMTLIAAPQSIRVLETEKLLIEIVIIGIPGSIYFSIVVFVDIRLANFPMT